MNGTWPTLEEVITKLIDDRVSSTQSEVDEYVNAAVKGLELVTQQGLIDAVEEAVGDAIDTDDFVSPSDLEKATHDHVTDVEAEDIAEEWVKDHFADLLEENLDDKVQQVVEDRLPDMVKAAVEDLKGALVAEAAKKAVDAVRQALMDALVDLEGK